MKEKRIENSVGWRLAIFSAIGILGQLIVSAIITAINEDFMLANSNNISLILPIIMVDLIGFPVFFLLTKKLPNAELGKDKFSLGEFILGLPIMTLVVLSGTLFGNFVQGLFTPSTPSAISGVFLGSSFFWRVLYIGILAPIFEEIIFRKLLIDKLSSRGRWFAIFVSALCFAFFHGNFSQFFYAFALGIIWGVIYSRTGNIFITMGYHLLINLSNSVIGVLVVANADSSKPETMLPVTIYGGFRIVMAIIGLVILIVRFKKLFHVEETGELTGGKKFAAAFTSWGLWLHYAICIALIVYQIVLTNIAM